MEILMIGCTLLGALFAVYYYRYQTRYSCNTITALKIRSSKLELCVSFYQQLGISFEIQFDKNNNFHYYSYNNSFNLQIYPHSKSDEVEIGVVITKAIYNNLCSQLPSWQKQLLKRDSTLIDPDCRIVHIKVK